MTGLFEHLHVFLVCPNTLNAKAPEGLGKDASFS